MSVDTITQDMVANQLVDSAMHMVSGDSYFYPDEPDAKDDSFIAALRVLLFGRIHEGDTLTFQVRRVAVPNGCHISDETLEEYNLFAPNSLTVCDFYPSCGWDYRRLAEAIRHFKQHHTEYKELDKVTKMFEKYGFHVHAYINPKAKSCVIMLAAFHCMNFYHRLQIGIPVYLPWYFNERPVTNEEKRLLSSSWHSYGNKERYIKEILSAQDRAITKV